MRFTPTNFAAASARTIVCRTTVHRLAVSFVALALAAGCSTTPETPVSEEQVHEVTGAVPAWPGEAQSSCGDRIAITRFNDDVGRRAFAETRVLLTSAQAYQDYFGHPAPAGVNPGREWIVFYASGKASGYTPSVNVVGVNGDVLHVVTTLTSPIPPCVPPTPIPGTTPGSSGSGSSMSGSTGGSTGTSGGTTGNAGASAPSGPTTASPTAPPPAQDVAPPDARRPAIGYVLVKFPAQKTHSVDFQHQDINPGCGNDLPLPTNPCAAILCKQGQTCVVLESFPPQAKCVDIKPEPTTRCRATADCAKGLVCSVERGECLGCGGAPGTACPAVCFGVCESPPSTGACTGGVLMNEGCLSEAQWKDRAAEECKKQKLELVDFGVGNACFASGFAVAKYSCCTIKPTPTPTPTPPTDGVCKVDSDCRLTSTSCGQDPCTCRAQSLYQIEPSCPMPAIACLVDPCAKQTAACVANRCVMQAASMR